MLEDLLYELGLVSYPTPTVKSVAEKRGVKTAEDLQVIIDYEKLIADVGDKLAPELRKHGPELRRETAIHMLKNAGRLPADYT